MLMHPIKSLRLYLQPLWRQFLAKRHPSETGKVRLRHQRLYIVPTLYGFGFGIIAITMLIGALNYQLSLGFFFAFLLIGVTHAILLRTYANLLGLELSCGNAQPVFAAENAYFPITLHNEKTQARYGINLVCDGGIEPVVCHVDGQSHCVAAVAVPSQMRGYLKLPQLKISSTMPMGFFRCWSYVNLDSQVLIYPQPELEPPPFPEHGAISDGKKMALSGNDDFAGLRTFQRGDARHDIAWKQSARTEQLLIRQHQSPLGATLWLNFDELHGLHTEARLSRLCAWILQAHSSQRAYGLALGPVKIEPNHGHDHLHRCLTALAEYSL